MGGKNKSKQSSSSQNVSQNQGANSSVGMNYGINQSGNFGSNNSSSQNGSQSTQNVWGAQSPFLQDVYGQGQNAFQQAMEQYQNMSPEVQQQMQDAYAQASGGFGNQMGGGFASGLQGQVGPNSYVDALKGDMMSDAQKIKQQNLGNLDARAAASGMSGSSGYRDQVGKMMDNVDEQTLQGMNQLGFNAHNQGIQNQLALAGMMDQNQANAMGNLGNMQQGAMAQFNPAMMGQQIAQNYAGTIGGPTTLGNSSSFGTSNSSGTNMGFSNGMNMGMNMGGGFNNGNSFGVSNGNGSSSGWNISPPSLSF